LLSYDLLFCNNPAVQQLKASAGDGGKGIPSSWPWEKDFHGKRIPISLGPGLGEVNFHKLVSLAMVSVSN